MFKKVNMPYADKRMINEKISKIYLGAPNKANIPWAHKGTTTQTAV
jgi:hypothetical protein